MDWPKFYEEEVQPELNAGDVYEATDHDWTKREDNQWRGTCKFCDSGNGRIFRVDPGALSWYCFKCDEGGGPPSYVHKESGGFGVPSGEDFKEAVRELASTAGVEVPEEDEEDGEDDPGTEKRKRRPLRNPKPRKQARRPQGLESASTKSKGGPATSPGLRPLANSKPTLDTPERELRKMLQRYRDALKESPQAKRYVEGRGVPAETLHAYGCGYAPPGEWPQDGKSFHRWENGRIVTPLTTPEGRLINLHGRAVGECPRKKRHRYLDDNPNPPVAYFNAAAINEETGPLVICEGPMDAFSFIVEGHARSVAIYNTDGVPWDDLRGSASALVFAFDYDEESETGQTDAFKRATEAVRRGFDAHTLHDEAAYAGHNDPNDALQAGELSLDYLEGIGTDSAGSPTGDTNSGKSHEGGGNPGPGGAENDPMTDGANGAVPAGKEDENTVSAGTTGRPERPANGSGTDEGQSPTPEATGEEDGAQEHTAADLVLYWDGSDVGHLGRWLWERGGVPDGDCGGGVYADRELHEWIEEALQSGPGGTTEEERGRLRRVLWRLYATHGPEDVPEDVVGYLAAPNAEPGTAADSPPRAADVWEERSRDPYRLGRLPDTVETTRTDAPKDNPHPGQRGIAIDSPYSADFVHDLKVLPEWARTWNGDAWVVDDCFAAFAGDLCRHYFG
ncbi:hypothetical protein GGP78_003241 [Salinibacter ruber]|uniref:hypothetical protein n=1 Tax=Salinibacter ruber TaxID=146919 RepID=UPI002168E271|nr:hypothetical protein [Salinibacter ruber]MCS3856537.1 hypothetical protein [Salinibacter ruber]